MENPPPYNEKSQVYPPPGAQPYPPTSSYAPVPGQPQYGGQAPYPPPQAYGQPYGQPPHVGGQYGGQTTVVVTQPVVVHPAHYRGVPVSVTCPHCRAQVVTAVTYTTGLLVWLLCLGLILIGCGLGCCLIPFCIDDLKDTTHYCPNCKQVLGQYRRI
jgi:lipopolysaccharide-induced tumor necrosis factor-alpha factor